MYTQERVGVSTNYNEKLSITNGFTVVLQLGKSTICVEKWFGLRKELAAVRTVCTHITNMVKGVTRVSSD